MVVFVHAMAARECGPVFCVKALLDSSYVATIDDGSQQRKQTHPVTPTREINVSF